MDDGGEATGLWYEDERVFLQGEPFTGVTVSCYPDGRQESCTTHWRGMKHGLQLLWYSNGQLKQQVLCFRGMDFGPYLKWHVNGQIAEQGRAAFGSAMEWVKFDEAGQEVGRESHWWHRGGLRELARLRADAPDAPVWLDEMLGPRGGTGPEPALLAPIALPGEQDWAPDWASFVGPQRVVVQADDDGRLSGLWRDDDENLIDRDDKPFSGIVLTHYADGSLWTHTTYWLGMKHGPLMRWYKSGQLSYRGACFRGGGFGAYTELHPNGHVAEQGYALFGQMLEWTKFDEQGKELGRQDYWDDPAVRRTIARWRELRPDAPLGLDGAR